MGTIQVFDHNLDPSGDVILTLRNPNNSPPAVCDSPPAVVCDSVAGAEPEPASGADALDKPVPVTFLVSSRHLVLASSVFKAMLKGGWNEGNKKDGRFRIRAEDWDVEALTTVMNILHSHYRQVPNTVTLKMLAKIAIIVDYYKLHEALQPMVMLWMKHLKQNTRAPFDTGRMLWILISWVFEDGEVFTKITRTMVIQNQKDIKVPEGLPIPLTIINRINQYRRESLGVIAAGLHVLQQDYTEGRKGCNFECSAILLGALIKNLHDHKLLGHPPETPFGLASVEKVAEKLRTIKTPTWYDSSSPQTPKHSGYYQDHRSSGQTVEKHQCSHKAKDGESERTTPETLVEFCRRLGAGVKDGITGLQLADFISDTEKQ